MIDAANSHDENVPLANSLRELAEMCQRAGVEEISVGDSGWSVRLKLDLSAASARPVPLSVAEPPEAEGPYVFSSEWVGVFHRSPELGAAPYVEEGQQLAAGDVVGVIAAMQLQHEVAVDRAGILLRFCVPDAAAVEYGQALLELG
jgi:biotin carboxyl carrier protein